MRDDPKVPKARASLGASHERGSGFFESLRDALVNAVLHRAEFELDLAEPLAVPRAARDGDPVIVEFGYHPVGVIMQREAEPHRLKLHQLTQRLPSDQPADEPSGVLWDAVPSPRPTHLHSFEVRPVDGLGYLQRPRADGLAVDRPVPQSKALIPEAAVGRVEVGGPQQLFGESLGPPHEIAEVGQRKG